MDALAHPARVAALLALCGALAFGGCKKIHHTDLAPLFQSGVGSSAIAQLDTLKLSDAEVQEVVAAHQGGFGDDACVGLVRLAHGQPGGTFTDGHTVAGLLAAGLTQDSVLELGRLNQLGLWAGEAAAMRLANLSDQVVLAVARRRAASEPVLSSAKVAALRNAGLSEKEIIDDIDSGTTDEQADAIVYKKNYDAGGHSFVRARGRRRR